MDQDQQVQAVLRDDLINFKSMISHLMSAEIDQRSQAESLFKLCYSKSPDDLALKLAQLFSSSHRLELRETSADILRKLLTPGRGNNDNRFIWPRLNPTTKASLKSILLFSLQKEKTNKIKKKICDVVLELASNLLPLNAWPELLPFLFQSVMSQSRKLKESALCILSKLLEYAAEVLQPYLPALHSFLLNCMTSAAAVLDVKIAALDLSIKIIQCLMDSAGRDQFQDLLAAMTTTLTEALKHGQEPRFLSKQLVYVVESMMQIAETDSLEEGSRHLALEFVIILAEARHQAPQFAGRVFALLMKMLLDVVDSSLWHTAETTGDHGERISYYVGKAGLDRLSIALGGNTIVPVALMLVPEYLTASEWQKRHAALVALAQIAEGCSKVMINNLERVLKMVLSSFNDPHPRVRWAALNCIGQLSLDLGPEMQSQYHQLVLPALVSVLDDFQNPRVQAHAAAAILNFTERCTADVLVPYLDVMVNKLLLLFHNGKKMVLEAALTALASVADSSQEQFRNYYYVVIPYLKDILVNATVVSKTTVCARALECITFVGIAVGKEMFMEAANLVLEVLMHLERSQFKNEGPIKTYMLQAWARLCKCLGQNFLPYMNVVMPPLLQSAQLNPETIITSKRSDVEIHDSKDHSKKVIALGEKIGIDTSVLEEKITACDMLCFYLSELKEGFFPWIDQVASCFIPLLKFCFHKDLQNAAMIAMPDLLLSAKLAAEKRLAQGCDASYLKKLSDYIMQGLVEALHKELDVEIYASMLGSLNKCIQISGYLLSINQVKFIMNELKDVVRTSVTRKKKRRERAKEGEILREQNEKEEDIFRHVGNILDILSKILKAFFVPLFDEFYIYITLISGKDKTADEKEVGICIFNNVAEQCKEIPLKYYHTYLPLLLNACSDENPHVRQVAVKGIGISAVFGGSAFRSMIGEVLSQLKYMIGNRNGQDPENLMAYDNAVSALGKVCLYHRENIDAAQTVPVWLSCLPIKNDLVQAKIMHDQLCSMFERLDVDLLGANYEFLPKVIAVLVEVIYDCKDLSTEETTSRMINLLRKVQQTLSPAVLASMTSSLVPEHQLVLQSILNL